jgi:hypothetical protein
MMTRRIGPLPAWGWVIIATTTMGVGAYALVWRRRQADALPGNYVDPGQPPEGVFALPSAQYAAGGCHPIAAGSLARSTGCKSKIYPASLTASAGSIIGGVWGADVDQ